MEMISGVDDALRLAQTEFPEISKDKENTFTKSRYASLDAIVSATRPALVKNNLLANHQVEDTEQGIRVTAVITHTPSKERRENSLSCDCGRSDPQKMGSALTYLRRYTLAPLLGITPDEDDDGNAAKPKTQEPTKKPAPQPAASHREAPPVATANLTPPPDWPNTPVHDLTKWIDATLKTTAHFKFALGLFKNEVGLYSMLAEWEPVLRHLGAAYKRVLGPVPKEKRDSTLEQEIAAEFTKLELDKQSKDTFQPKADDAPAETPAS